MSKIIQFVFAMSCLRECEKNCYKGRPIKKGTGLHWVEETLNNIISKVLFDVLLAIGIFMGWVILPTYLGDGYDYDNF